MIRRIPSWLSFILVLSLAGVAVGSGVAFKYSSWQKGPWDKHKNKKRMTMWLNDDVPTGDVEGIRIDTMIPMPADEIFPILVDPDRAAKYSFIREFKVIKRYDDWGYLYQRVKATGVDDRDFTVYVKMIKPEKPNTGQYGWVWKQANEKGPAPVEGVVRAKDIEGSYILTPIGQNRDKTLVSYRLWFDPNTWVPDFLINMAARKSAWETIRRLREDATRLKKTGSWQKK